MSAELEPTVGHNGGPELDDDDPTGRQLFVKWAWTQAYNEVWKTPPMDILRFRVARAEAAGLTYRAYMLQLLDTGRYPQAPTATAAAKPKRPLAKPGAVDHSLRQVKPPSYQPVRPAAPPPSVVEAVDSRLGHTRKPSPMAVSGLHKVHK